MGEMQNRVEIRRSFYPSSNTSCWFHLLVSHLIRRLEHLYVEVPSASFRHFREFFVLSMKFKSGRFAKRNLSMMTKSRNASHNTENVWWRKINIVWSRWRQCFFSSASCEKQIWTMVNHSYRRRISFSPSRAPLHFIFSRLIHAVID